VNNKIKLLILIAGVFLILAAALLLFIFYHPAKRLEVNFFDVGQGDAILIKAPDGQNILIDGGPNLRIVERLSAVLMPWDKKIDLMVLTHPHDDHVTGLVNVLERFKVEKILYTGVNHDSPNYIAWLSAVRDKKIPLVILDRPRTIKLGDNCRLEILYPLKSFLNKEVENLNNTSIVMKLAYGETSFLFTGDAEREEEKEILESGVELSADVLKIGHHGSDTSSSGEFLAAVKPDIAVISVGKDNDFGHPSLRTIKKLERAGAKVFRTDEAGTIKIVSDGTTVVIKK
jgi:competence protein ComEC